MVNTSNKPIEIRRRKPNLKIMPDKENENNPAGKDAESKILQVEENLTIDTTEKKKKISDKNLHLIKEHKQSSNPSKTPKRLKAKPDTSIMENSFTIQNQIKINIQCNPKVSYSRRPGQQKNNLLPRRPFR
ncbi:Hypothetical protein CINCED_3A005458 [Cinara cedri]|uniref:Uncharacterized protein n=1 Tax=Cinara cedri TaxID=506608 RepID=A0A5E4MDX6_9HEMI|nr:Hypothetical protein CINCED_3A005458 [Cinara cedri]